MSTDGVPPVQQERGLPAAMEGLPDRMPFSGSYRYVIFHFWFITITRRSLSVAIAASCLTFVALQVCSNPSPGGLYLESVSIFPAHGHRQPYKIRA